MSQRYIGNAERSKQKENQQGILKNLRIMLENSAEGLGPGESAAGVTYLSMRTHSKLQQLYIVVQGRTQLEHSSFIVMVGVDAKFKPWLILIETIVSAGPFETMSQEPWHPGKGTKPDSVIQRNVKCAPMQIIKQPEHRRTSTSEEQKWSSFQTNYD